MGWMHGAALFAGSAAGALNYLLLARFSFAFLGGRRAWGWLAGALLLPLAGLALAAAFAPRFLAWYGGAAGGFLALLAMGRMVCHIWKEKR